jgi:hypothetical protein
MPQFARPVQDIARGSWTTHTGGTTDLWTTIDELDADDADFIQAPNNSNTAGVFRLSPLVIPLVRRLHVVNVRARKAAVGGNIRGLTTELLQGATVIASRVDADLTALWPTLPLVLTRTEAEAITDYSALAVRLTTSGTFSGGGAQRRAVQVSWCQFRVPDATDLLDDWRTSWGVPVGVTTLEQLIAWLEPQTEGDPPDPVWVRRYNLAIAVWKLSAYRPMLEQINAGSYPLPAHQTQQFAATKIAGKLTRFQTIADTLDAEDNA